MKKGRLKRKIRIRESREKIDKLEFEGEIEGAGARWGRVGGGTRRARGETRSDLRCPGRGGPGGRALLPAPLPAAAVRAATFRRVSHTLAIKEPQSPGFSRAPPPPGPEKLFFTPSWSLICCGERKRLLLSKGLRGGPGGGAGDCVSRSCAPGAAGVGPPGRGAGARARRARRSSRAGVGRRGAGAQGRGRGRPGQDDRPEWGQLGRGMRAGGSQGLRGWRKRPPGRASPLSSWPCSAPGPEIGGRWTLVERADAEKAAHPEEVVYSGRGPRELWETHHTFKQQSGRHTNTHTHTLTLTRDTDTQSSGRVPQPERGQQHTGRNTHSENNPLTQTHTHTHTHTHTA